VNESEAYQELCAYTLTRGDTEFIHQYVVDAFAVQSANADTKPITVAFALVGLYLHVERALDGRAVQRAHQRLARNKRAWPRFTLPEDRGALTPRDVMMRDAGPDRDGAIHDWAVCVWEAVTRGSASRSAVRLLGDEVVSFQGARGTAA
jgi:hypothetical protein